jgi:hypothetical protein
MRKPSQSMHCSWCDQPIPGNKSDEIGARVAARESEFKTNLTNRLIDDFFSAEILSNPRFCERMIELQPLVPRKRVGRPTKPPLSGERIPIGLRVTPEIKTQLDTAAKQNGRSLSQEVEMRLERSFDRQKLLPEVLTLTYREELSGLLMLLGAAMDEVGRLHINATRRGDNLPDIHWTDEHTAFDQAVQAANIVLKAARPSPGAGEPQPTSTHTTRTTLAILNAVRGTNLGIEHATATHLAPTIRLLLGGIANRLLTCPRLFEMKDTTQAALSADLSRAIADRGLGGLYSSPRIPSRVRATPMSNRQKVHTVSHGSEKSAKDSSETDG